MFINAAGGLTAIFMRLIDILWRYVIIFDEVIKMEDKNKNVVEINSHITDNSKTSNPNDTEKFFTRSQENNERKDDKDG